jgi:hypothetical protein
MVLEKVLLAWMRGRKRMVTREADRSGELGRSEEERRPVQPATRGVGELLQRDYVIVIEGSAYTPEQVVEMLRRNFPRFSPAELARFTRPSGEVGPLDVGDTMHIRIRGRGECGVIVSHLEPHSLTLRTLGGHPEAGRISFGAYRDAAGRLVCRIRSRSRLRDLVQYAGYRLLGKPAQTETWDTFLERVAETCGGRVLGKVLTSTDRVTESDADRGFVERSTFDECI